MTSGSQSRGAWSDGGHGDRLDGSVRADSLQTVREEIDRVDDAIVGLLTRRVRFADTAREFKQQLGVPLFDTAREAAIVRRAAERAAAASLDPELVRDIFWRIVQLARVAQLDETDNT